MKKIFLTVEDHLTQINTFEKGCWIHLQNPTREEIEGLNARFSLDPTYLLAALDEEESARIEREDDQMLIIVDVPYVEAEENGYSYSTIPMGIIVVDDVIINDFTEERIRGFWTFKRTRFILQLLNRNASRYLSYLKQIDKASNFVHKRLQANLRNRELIQMMQMEKSLVYFSTSLKGNEMVLEKMMRLDMLRKYPEDADLLEDVIIENKQAIEMCAIYRDIMNGMTDAYASLISNNLNMVMKILTSLTVIMAIPTLIASYWGMNTGVPFQGTPWGFWAVVGISLVMAFASFFLLWKKKMF